MRCRKGKTKCVYENGRAPCKNCSKGMHECYLPSESMSHGGHGVSPARAARARETLPSERASGAATGDRHGSAHPTTVASRNSAPATEKYVCIPARSLSLFVHFLGHFPVHLSCHPRCARACVSCLRCRLASLASHPPSPPALPWLRAQALGLPWFSSARLLSVALAFLESHTHTQRHTNHVHLSCILIHHRPQRSQYLPWSKGSEMMHRIDCGLAHPCLLRLAPTSISFPYFPCCHCARRAAASSGTHYPILEPTPILGGHSSDTCCSGAASHKTTLPGAGVASLCARPISTFSAPAPCRTRPGGHRPRLRAGSIHVQLPRLNRQDTTTS